MRIPSGVTDQVIYFVAVDSTDFTTRETGLSSFTVYWSRNGSTPAADASVTVSESDATNMPGVYEYTVTEGTTIDAGDDSQEYVLHITHASMAPVTRTIEIYRPILTTVLTEAYAADGSEPTLTQAIYLIQQFLSERAVSGTTTTVKKLDGSTTAATYTLSDATNPVSITRAT